MNFNYRILFAFIAIAINASFCAAQEVVNYQLNWKSSLLIGLEGQEKQRLLNFEGAVYDLSQTRLPIYFLVFEEKDYRELRLTQLIVEELSAEELALVREEEQEVADDFQIQLSKGIVRKKTNSEAKISTIRKTSTGKFEKLVSFQLEKLEALSSSVQVKTSKQRSFAKQSALASGDWYKIAVTKEGVFKLNYQFLESLGVDPSSIDPRQLKIYGYGGGMLPEANSDTRPDDMQENAIVVVGEQDGVFNKGDYILFYGEDQVAWRYDLGKNMFRHQKNLYTDTCFYFLKIDGIAGKRITQSPPLNQPATIEVSQFDAYAFHEKDEINLLKSGKLWLGELFDNVTSRPFEFNIPNVTTAEQGKLELSVFARSAVVSQFNLETNGQNFSTRMNSTSLISYINLFARPSRSYFDFTPNSGLISMNLTYSKPQSVSKGWLNSLTVNVRSALVLNSGQLQFRDSRSVGPNAIAKFKLQSASNPKVWDISDKYNIKELSLQREGANLSFVAASSTLQEYIAFEEVDSVNIYAKGKVATQNLHGLPQAELVIVSHPSFMLAAEELAAFHRAEGLSVNIVTPQQIYNEYSSGAQDLVGIRSFLKMFYDRSSSDKDLLKYVVLMGDASYDYKDRIKGNTNYVPAFQSSNSIDPVSSHVSDDYFGFLDDSEGRWLLGGGDRLDIAVGRFPVQTLAEAQGVVNKVKRYAAASSRSDWRNTIVFVGDDEDGVKHMDQSNSLATMVDTVAKEYNLKKIFLDAYQQQSTASGARYPDVTKDLNQAVEKGALIVNYTGHGGETGWTAERVLGIYDISNWKNIRNQPLFVTATCEFSRFDDPLRTSGGELVVLNPNGGGVGLLTTTRLVYADPNFLLNLSFYRTLFDKNRTKPIRLGEIFQKVKNLNAYSGNSRNFSLLGDPALKLAIPTYKVETTSINEHPIRYLDTVNALSLVTVKGRIIDNNGSQLNQFNGLVYPTVFDKVEEKKTLNNDGGGVFKYLTQERRIFKGKATVQNGEFSFSFIVPKDISYNFGRGKISYYANDNAADANGYTDNFFIGGSSSTAIGDNEGPEIDLYMNNEQFVFGGITDANPTLLVHLSDEQGINTVGSGLGHDLVATLDDNTEQVYILNEFYEAAVDDYSSGKVSFPFKDLTEGKHLLRVKAWDIGNNSSERTIEFTVVKSKDIEIRNLVNYPNPFTTNTEFIFEHNQVGVPLDVKLEIFTTSGKLVKSIDKIIVTDGFISRDVKWDGRDDFGDRIGKGVYIYKLSLRSGNGATTEKIEKLVIL